MGSARKTPLIPGTGTGTAERLSALPDLGLPRFRYQSNNASVQREVLPRKFR